MDDSADRAPRRPPAERRRSGPRRPSAGGADRPARRAGAGAGDRREPGPAPRHADPPLAEDVTGAELDKEVRADLRSLSKEGGSAVARHLVMVARLLHTDPEAAWQHALAARRRAGRIGAVREAAGLAAYAAGHFEEALRELRTARRLTGSEVHLPVMADCERGLGRPERALALAASPEARALDPAGQVELRIVAAGARVDMGNPEAAVVTLQPVAERAPAAAPWRARLYSALADALDAAGRQEEARQWLARAADADLTGETGARERLSGGPEAELVVDILEDEEDGARPR